MKVNKDIVFHDAITAANDGEIYEVPHSVDEMIICISGTSTSRTVTFTGATFGADAFCPITGYKEGSADFDTAISTTGTSELWRFDLSGLTAIQFPVTAVSGGNVTIKGRATG